MKQTRIIITTLLTTALLGACGTSNDKPTDNSAIVNSALVAIYCDGAADFLPELDGKEPGVIMGFKLACEAEMASGTSLRNPDFSIEGFPG